ncbi:MAG: glycosyl hydrolase 53 family protein [Lachnospiraceae bacterium]|nr:glycosyl hydrolase 53 family protein [Lachnospiraceae bacterium]
MKKAVFKRSISAVLTTVLAVSLFAGCGSENINAGDNKDSASGYTYTAPTESETAGIFVEPVEGISDDFIRGVDISSVISLEESGVTYKNFDGEEEDLFKILADQGVNYIRVRVWNDPYDANGNGYGGGNCDADKAAIIGKRAAEYGMKLLVDFHYSDFWADPSKQQAPKAWEGKSIEEKASMAYDFTLETMNKILDAGADVGMVQLGNESNNQMSGESKWAQISQIVSEGRRAVLEAGAAHGNDDIQIALHFTNISDFKGIKGLLRKLESCAVEYDIFAVSYYNYWHGTLENLTEVLSYVAETTGKKVMVAETSYCYTLEDGDGHSNSVGEKDINKNYAPSVQSQANAVRDVFAAAAAAGDNCLGVFYWEPAWVPVEAVDWNSADANAVYESNKKKWEQFGSGWASSYAGEYDPKDAGKWYGGSAWDNQAMFDHNGRALESLKVFKYLKYGATSELKVDFANDILVTVNPGSELVMPSECEVHFNDRSKNGLAPITWNPDELAQVDPNVKGEYQVTGSFEDGTTITATINVANVNWVLNPSFEEEDRSMWEFVYSGDTVLDFQQKETDATTGEWAMHYWRQGAVSFEAQQTITGLQNGTYYLTMNAQGGDSGTSVMYLFARKSDGFEYACDYDVNGWCEWQHPEISGIEVTDGTLTIGVHFDGGEGAWGTFDDFYLCLED